MNLPGIVFQRFIKFARRTADPDPFILIFYSNQICLYTRAHIYRNFLPSQKFLSEILYATGKHRHDSRICAQACVLLLPPANKYADVSATAFYSAVKMIKKDIDCPTTLKCWNTYGKAPPPDDVRLLPGINAHPTLIPLLRSPFSRDSRDRFRRSRLYSYRKLILPLSVSSGDLLQIKLFTAGHS